MKEAVFGVKLANKKYQDRFGAYGIVVNENQEMVIIQAPNGAYFLPGGGTEKGENHQEAIKREMIEELGFEVKVGEYLGEATEYFYSSHRDIYFRHPAYFYVIDAYRSIGKPLEDNNQIEWVTADDAMLLLKRGSHRWAVQKWMKANQK